MSIEAYGRYWETLRPETVRDLLQLARPDLVFRDPFNEMHGVEPVMHMLQQMFQALEQPQFAVRHTACSGAVCFVRWDFSYRLRGRASTISGVSEIELDDMGLVARHIDHWDAARQVYEHIPLLGGLLRMVRRRLAASA